METENKTANPTILVVDDNPDMLRIMGILLKRAGYSVLEADSANAAARVWKEHSATIDLLVTDVVMPGKTGLELVDDLREERPELKVIVVSGFLPEFLQAHLDSLKATIFLAKPFSPQNLTEAVRQSLFVPSPVIIG